MSSDPSVTTATSARRRPRGRWGAAGFLALSGAVALTAACSQGPASPTYTVPVSPNSVTEVFRGTLAVGGSAFYSFSVPGTGTIVASLSEVGGADVPASVALTMGIGNPGGTSCLPTTSAEVQVSGTGSLTNQVTSSPTEPGVFCVILRDTGNLPAPASFTVIITHP